MTGFASKRAMNRINPIIVDSKLIKSWPSMLHTLWLRHAKLGRSTHATEIVHKRMQTQWPGPYTIEEVYDDSIQSYTFKLKFEDPHQKLIWLLANTW